MDGPDCVLFQDNQYPPVYREEETENKRAEIIFVTRKAAAQMFYWGVQQKQWQWLNK